MPAEAAIRRWQRCYGALLRLYPHGIRTRFAAGMEQNFSDLLRERAAQGKGLTGAALWLCSETFTGIIRENISMLIMQQKNLVRILAVTGCILLIQVIGMQVSDEWNWGLFDFVFAAVLLIGCGLLFDLAARQTGDIAYRLAAALAVLAAFLLVWIYAAVGIIGDDNPANLLYFGVLASGLVGAAAARLRPLGMARALFAMAGIQLLVPVVALAAGSNDFSPGVLPVFALNGFFVALFAGSALLFRRAARTLGAANGGQWQ